MPSVRLASDKAIQAMKVPKGQRVDYFDEGLGATDSKGALILRVNEQSKAWSVLYYVDKGTPKKHGLGRWPDVPLTDARAKAREFLKNPAKALARAAAGTFPAVARQFVQHCVSKGLRTADEIERCFRVYLSIEVEDDDGKVTVTGPRWRDKKFLAIELDDVSDMLDEIESRHGPRQADVVLAYVRRCMRWYATRRSYVVPIAPGMQRARPAKERARKRVLSDDELRAVWSASEGLGRFGGIVRLLLLTAQRQAKAASLKRGDLRNGVWAIASELREKGNAQALPLPLPALDVIAAQPVITGTDFVFPAAFKKKGTAELRSFCAFTEGKEKLDARMLDRLDEVAAERGDQAMAEKYREIRALLQQAKSDDAEKKAAARAQLKTRWWVLHDLRRTAKTLMQRAGVLPHISERVLGHSIDGVEGVYDRYEYFEEKAEALQKLAALVERILNPSGDNVIPLRAAE